MFVEEGLFYLERLDGEQEIPLREDLTVGRRDTGLVLTGDPLISKDHCIFRVTGLSVSLMDQGSANGTFVNGTKIKSNSPVFLQHNDTIGIGRLQVRFVDQKIEEALQLPGVIDSLFNPLVGGVSALVFGSILFFILGEPGMRFGLKHSIIPMITLILLCWVLATTLLAPVMELTLSLNYKLKDKIFWAGLWSCSYFSFFALLSGFCLTVVPVDQNLADNRLYLRCIKSPQAAKCLHQINECPDCLSRFSEPEREYIEQILSRHVNELRRKPASDPLKEDL